MFLNIHQKFLVPPNCRNGEQCFPILILSLMSRIECKYCLISNSCLAGFFDIFDSIVCFGDFFLTYDQASLIFFVVAGRYA